MRISSPASRQTAGRGTQGEESNIRASSIYAEERAASTARRSRATVRCTHHRAVRQPIGVVAAIAMEFSTAMLTRNYSRTVGCTAVVSLLQKRL